MSDKSGRAPEKQFTTLKVFAISAVGVGLGLVILWLSADGNLLGKSQAAAALFSSFGGLVVATSLVTLGWELVGKRTFAREVMSIAHLAADIESAGIQRITDQYLDAVEWSRLLQGSSRVDIVVAYASTWRNTHRGNLEQIAHRPGSRLRVYLPDPDCDQTMRILADRFAVTPDVLRGRVQEAISDFFGLRKAAGGDVEVYVRSGDAVFSCYRMDGRAVLTLYSHTRKRRSSVPTFLVSGGQLWDFVYDEINAIREQSRRVFPSEEQHGQSTEADNR